VDIGVYEYGYWSDRQCEINLPFICEKDVQGDIVIGDTSFDNTETGGAQVGEQVSFDITLSPAASAITSLQISIGQPENCELSWEGSSSNVVNPLEVTFAVGDSSQTVTVLCDSPTSGDNALSVVQIGGSPIYEVPSGELRPSLLVYDVPGAPQRPSAISIASGTGVLNFLPPEEDNNAAVTDYIIEWDLVTDFESTIEDQENGSDEGPASTLCTGASCQFTFGGSLQNQEFYKVKVIAVNRAGESNPSEVVMFKVFPNDFDFTGCPTTTGDAFGPIQLYTTENSARQEQLTVIVSWYFLYNSPADCDDCYTNAPIQMVEFEFGNRDCDDECRITSPTPQDYADLTCGDVFNVGSACPNWGFVRFDLVMTNEMNTAADFDGCGFDKSTLDQTYLEYTTDLISTAELFTSSLFGTDAFRAETIHRPMTVKFPKTVVDTLDPMNVWGEPIKELFPSSIIDVVDQVHHLVLQTRTQYPYIIDSATIREIGGDITDPDTTEYTLTIGDATCSGVESGQPCEQTLTISTGEGGGFPFPNCADELEFEVQVIMLCFDDLFDCEPIPGGCTFHISTSFCGDLTVTADNVYGLLLTYPRLGNEDPELEDIETEFPFFEKNRDLTVTFAYSTWMYYELDLFGLTGSDVELTGFEIRRMNGNPNADPYLSASDYEDYISDYDQYSEAELVLDNWEILPVGSTHPPYTQFDEASDPDGYRTPTIVMLKDFDEVESRNRDSLIFKHQVNEHTFPLYPEDRRTPVHAYKVTATVTNNGFKRRLETNFEGSSLGPVDMRSLTLTDRVGDISTDTHVGVSYLESENYSEEGGDEGEREEEIDDHVNSATCSMHEKIAMPAIIILAMGGFLLY